MLQIVFNEISANELSQLDTLSQLDLLDRFKVTEETLQNIDGETFGKIDRAGKTLYRCRVGDHRVYFEVSEDRVLVHRVLHANTFSDFLFRSSMPVGEDEALSKSKHFWNLIEEGERSRIV